jgi:Glycosyl hydrolase family 92 catalytic domain
MGGEAKFTEHLDTFFEKSAAIHLENLLPNPWFWAGNEPDIQTPYLYQYANQTEKTTKVRREEERVVWCFCSPHHHVRVCLFSFAYVVGSHIFPIHMRVRHATHLCTHAHTAL